MVVAEDSPQDDKQSTVSESELSESQRQELDKVLVKYDTIFSTIPGLTDLTEFHIKTNSEQPISLKPYTIPLGLEEQLKK